MKPITKAALLTIAAASIGAASMAPALAQPFGGGHHAIQRIPGLEARSFRPDPDSFGGFGMRGGLMGMFLGSAEAIDVAAVRLSHRLDLTEDQQALLEELRLAARDAQVGVAQVREEFTSVPEETATEADIIAGYAGLVAMTTARAEALEAVQPAFEAFVESLDETQIEALTPRRPGWNREAPVPPQADGSEAEG